MVVLNSLIKMAKIIDSSASFLTDDQLVTANPRRIETFLSLLPGQFKIYDSSECTTFRWRWTPNATRDCLLLIVHNRFRKMGETLWRARNLQLYKHCQYLLHFIVFRKFIEFLPPMVIQMFGKRWYVKMRDTAPLPTAFRSFFKRKLLWILF